MAHPTWGSGSVGRVIPPSPAVDHFIVVGSNALAHRLVVELTEHYDVPVVAIIPDIEHDHGPQIVKLLGAHAVVTAPVVGDDALHAADIDLARGIALLGGGDQDKLHGALRAQALNEGIRIVLAMDSTWLGEGIERLLWNCAVLSSAVTAAPAFVNAALHRRNSVHVGGQSLAVTIRDGSNQTDFLMTVADQIDVADLTRTRLLPNPAPSGASSFRPDARPGVRDGRQAVLEFVQEHPNPTARRLALGWQRLVTAWKILTRLRMKILFGVAAIVALAAFVVTTQLGRPFGWALYDTILGLAHVTIPDTFGQPSGTGGTWQRVTQVTLALDGLLLAALVTAALIGSIRRPQDPPKRPDPRIRGHVIVVGLDEVGTRITQLLHELDIPVVCIERDPAASGVGIARDLGIPVLTSMGQISARLREARVQHSRAVVAVSATDVANLQAALEARSLAPDVRLVLRLFDDDLAAQVYRTFANTASRSVTYLAAPAFAAALMGREVLGTFSVYRHVVLVAALLAEDGSELVGLPLHEIEIPGELRVIAMRAEGARDYLWRPDRGRRMSAGDHYVVLATRAGLARHIAWTNPSNRDHDPRHRNRAARDADRPRNPPATDEFTIAVYLTDAAHGEAVKAAVHAYLSAIGAEITEDNEPVIGSWSWFAKARRLGKAAADSQAGQQAGNLAESLAWGPVRSRQADINLINSQAVANLVQSLADSPNGLILVGSLLVVKSGNVPIVVMLSQEQVNTLERRPALLRQPETILDDLQRAYADQAADLDPPTLTG